MSSTYTTGKLFEKITDNEQENTWGTAQRSTLDLIDKSISQTGTLTCSAGTNTVSDADAVFRSLDLTGTATANIIHLMPARPSNWLVNNGHSQGTYTVQMQPSGGTAVTIPPGYHGEVQSDGTTAQAVQETITGSRFKSYAEIGATNGTAGTAATIDLEDGNVHDVTLTSGTCTFTFSNPTASGDSSAITLYLRQDATGGRVASWPSSVTWPGGVAPTLSTASADLDKLVFETINGGTSWEGNVAGQAYA